MSKHPQPEAQSSATPNGIVWNEHKAGLQNVDKAYVNKVVLDASVGSKFYSNEERKDAELSAKIELLKAHVEEVKKNEAALKAAEKRITNKVLPEVEKQRIEGRTILHLDMDCTLLYELLASSMFSVK